GKGIFSPGCGRGSVYSFLASAEWSPQKEVYKVGDTLYLTSIIPKTLTDQINTSIVVDYSNSDGIYGDIPVRIVDTVMKQVLPAKDSFQFISIVGNFQERTFNQKDGINFNYLETPTNYQFRGAMVCKGKGIYALGVSDLLSGGLRGKNCMKAVFKMTITNSNKNLGLYQNVLGITLDADGIQRGYAFRVQ
ncbi:hypothetical protein, partial [Hydrotalea sp.]|uniref:hypothetical protein n=1 Tax=Hydrotalea sp. TaxID=2881279 RepID=UPI00262F07C3